jgi:hypothetical protein
LNDRRDRRWWQAEQDDAHVVVHEIASRLDKENPRRTLYRHFRSLYGDEWGTQAAVGTYAAIGVGPGHRDNVVANGIDACHSRLAKNRPRPWVVTIGGNWQLSRKAKSCTKWLEGEFERLGTHVLGERALKEAMIVGTGCIKTYECEGFPKQELVLAENLHVDPQEEENNCVRTLYQTMAVDRQVLIDRYPDKEFEIASAHRWEQRGGGRLREDTADLVLVAEAWHLPSSKKSPGRHVICVDTTTLADEEWTEDYFPFDFVHWRQVEGSFWGMGLAQSMAGVQLELDGMTGLIAECFSLSVPSVWIRQGAQINVEKIDNVPYRLHTFVGDIPVLQTPPAIHEQFIAREDALIGRAYEMQGISQLGAQSQKPAGIDSGKGLRTLHDIETERFLTQARNYEQLYVGMAKKLIDVCEQICERGEGAELRATVGKSTLEEITYGDVRFKDQPHEIRVFPASQLSSSPQGKIKDVEDLMAIGSIDAEEGRELLDFPDLDRANTIRSAKRENAKRLIEKPLYDGLDTADQVSPYCDLPYMQTYGAQLYNLAEIDGCPEENLAKLRATLGMVDSLLAQAAEAQAQAAAAAAPPPAGPPPAPPMPAGPGLAAVPGVM